MKIISIDVVTHTSPISVYDVVSAEPYHNFIVNSNGVNIVAHNCNFAKAGVKDVNKAKAHMRDTYNTVSARVKGTFKHGGQVFGKIFAVSSKRSDSDFMEAYAHEQIDAGAGGNLYISDAPQWEVLPPDTYSKERFYIAVGDKSQKSFVVPENQTFPAALEELKSLGFQLLQPPIDMRTNFLADFNIALRDLAGIAVVGTMSFITQDVIDSCLSAARRNPFYQDILQVGTKDGLVLEDFFHINEVTPDLRRAPMFIHLDLATTTDRAGISGGVISGRQDIKTSNDKVVSQPFFSHIFSIAIEAPRGDKIPFAKITALICWLRKAGFNISRISRDQYQSDYMAELLEAQGFTVDKISLDRTPDGYIATRSILLENRIDMLHNELLEHELIHLQRDASGRCDHPVGGSKDVSDSFAGWIWNAIQHNPGISISSGAAAKAIASVNGRSRLLTSTANSRLPGGIMSDIYKNYK